MVLITITIIIPIIISIHPRSTSLPSSHSTPLHHSHTLAHKSLQSACLEICKKLIEGVVGGREAMGERKKTKSRNLLVRFVAVGQTS